MARTYTMQDMIEAILKLAGMSDTNRKQGDVERANNCTMVAYGEARVLKFLGVDYDFGTYQDDEYERIGYFMVDGVTLIKNGIIDWKAYGRAVVDEEHGWFNKELIVRERS